MLAANPYLNFNGNAEDAFNFYRTVFGGEFQSLIRFSDFPDNPMGVPEHEMNKIAHIALPLGNGNLLMATDVLSVWNPLMPGNNFYIAIETETPEEADRLFDALAEGGKVAMGLERTEWAEKYGDCTDRYGVQWMIMYTGSVQFGGSNGH